MSPFAIGFEDPHLFTSVPKYCVVTYIRIYSTQDTVDTISLIELPTLTMSLVLALEAFVRAPVDSPEANGAVDAIVGGVGKELYKLF